MSSDDPDVLLNEWLGELESLIGGLEVSSPAKPRLRPNSHTSSERTDSYRFSMANLEETHEAELDAILGELSLLEKRGGSGSNEDPRGSRCHSRNNSIVTNTTISSESSGCVSGQDSSAGSTASSREPRTDSPDNDSAFSDTVSLLSSESSTSSSLSVAHLKNLPAAIQTDSAKAAKIHLALQKLEQASIRRLFVKAFSADGASKSLLVDETMTCGHVTRLLADKNHVPMETHWALVEHLPDLQMERLFEDHELLVDNLMLWSRDSKNRVLFLQRPDKVALFAMPERFLPGTQMAPGSDHDEHTRAMLMDEFFTTGGQISMEAPLYLKSDSKKGWKRYHFVLRASGLYYYPKEKTKSPKDLLCLALFAGHDVYRGLGWKKKHKAPTDFTFALRCPKAASSAKSVRVIKMLCADNAEELDRWVTAIRVAKYGKRLLDNQRALLEDLAREELDKLTSARSNSIVATPTTPTHPPMNGRVSRASSSSSSGCLSDENNGFDSEFTTGTIKRKPSMKPNLPLTSVTSQLTRQLKEVGETTRPPIDSPTCSERGGTLTRRHSRRRSEEEGSSGGTLKRRPSTRGSVESMSSTPTPTATSPTLVPISPLEAMPACMTDSTFSLPPPPPPDDLDTSLSASLLSLDSLPPPPCPSELETDLTGSQISLVSLPPPPPDVSPIVKIYAAAARASREETTPPKIAIKPTIKAPPYKSPPPYNGSIVASGPPPLPSPKSVSFAESPVLLRRKVCFQDQVYPPLPSVSRRIISNAPLPPPRADATRLSDPNLSPKRLADSTSNPPRDFLKDLQRVMRKKWQVAQKCKMEPATTPHEVLGFRDLSPDASTHFYTSTNVSHWVQEHYGVDSLYENLGSNAGLEPVYPTPQKKRPPPPPPRRAESTHLTTQRIL